MPSEHYPEAKLSKTKFPSGQNTLFNHLKLQHYQEKNAKNNSDGRIIECTDF